MDLKNNLQTKTGWEIIEKSFDPAQIVNTGSNFMIGNGYLGYRGTFDNWRAEEFVACIVTDTWDQAEGSRWSELCNVPNGMFSELSLDEEACSLFSGTLHKYQHSLDLRYGINTRKIHWESPGGKQAEVAIRKFASKDNHHLLVEEFRFKALDHGIYTLRTGIDGKVWSLNGDHFQSCIPALDGAGLLGLDLKTTELGTRIAVVSGQQFKGATPASDAVVRAPRELYRDFQFELRTGEEVVMEKVVSITHDNEVPNPLEIAKQEVTDALRSGFEALLHAHQAHWDAFWEVSDIQVGGNMEAQLLTRFNLYQAFIATPTHANLPVGARGLSCQVYQGAAFWDQETYNLPMFVFSHLEIAKRLVAYRYDTLDGARRKAKRLGYYGAFYAWTSGKTGDELFPDFFFNDVLSGRPIRNHFNCWQIHISPDVVYGIWLYFQATNDWEFMLEQGAEVLFEVAQFLVSRVHFKMDREQYEIIRVLGPDEYHENVDNNAFTNYLCRFALQKACLVFDKMAGAHSDKLDTLLSALGLNAASRDAWEDIATRIYLPEPDPKSKVIEQFNGYFELEDIRPDQLRKRLIDPDEYWGWPNGIAVHTQVLKQADVIQLLAMLDIFPNEVLTANYEYYEPRTEHGSSLSPSVHALVASRAGHQEEAYRYFMESASIDLYNASKKVMSGGSFLGGIHTAAAGGVWLIIVKGFAGFVLTEKGVGFSPALPKAWKDLRFKLRVRGCLLLILLDGGIRIQSAEENASRIFIQLPETSGWLEPGGTLQG